MRENSVVEICVDQQHVLKVRHLGGAGAGVYTTSLISKTGVYLEASWSDRRRKARFSGSVHSGGMSSRRTFVAWAKESSPVS